MTMTKNDIRMIGDEMVRLLEPVYGDLESIKHTQTEHTDKIDALTADMVQVQNEVGVIKDDIKNVKDDLSNVKSDLKNVKDDLKNVKSDLSSVKDDVKDIKDGLDRDKKEHQKEHQLIRKHISIPIIAHQIKIKNK